MLRFLLFSSLLVCVLGRAPEALRPRFGGRIVGGEGANIEDYPYQLVFQLLGSLVCGASIVSENLAITAAHCTDEFPVDDMTVRAGSSIFYQDGTVHQVTKVHQHPAFHRNKPYYDISILEVNPPFQYGPGVGPIALPDSDMDVPIGTMADVSGWGALSYGGTIPSHLRHVVVKVLDQKECEDAYGNVTDSTLCAGDDGKDFCYGDNGGPLVVDGKLVGIVSFNNGCANARYPGVYAKVTAFRTWIWMEVGM